MTKDECKRIIRNMITNVSRGDYGESGKEIMGDTVRQINHHYIDGAMNELEEALGNSLHDELKKSTGE